MLLIIRGTKNRKSFIENYMLRKLPEAKVEYDDELKKDNSAFVLLLENLTGNGIILEDDQFLRDDFLVEANNLIEKHCDSVICFSQIKFEKGCKAITGFKYVNVLPTFALYIPKEIGNGFAKWYKEKANIFDEYYGNALAHYLKEINKPSYFINDSLTGHDISQYSIIGHNKTYPSLNFDYKKAFEIYSKTIGFKNLFKEIVLKNKLKIYEEE